jgi:hypothetical protein
VDGRFEYPLIAASNDFLLYSPQALGNQTVVTSAVSVPKGFNVENHDYDPLTQPFSLELQGNITKIGGLTQSPSPISVAQSAGNI